jgi:PAS domain S-box-containing protein
MNSLRIRERVRLRVMARSLGFKATLAVASFLVMISVLLSTLFAIQVEQGQREALLHHAEEWAAVVTEAVAKGVEANDPGSLNGMLEAVERTPDILYLVVHGERGELASWRGRCSPATKARLDEEAPLDFYRTPSRRATVLRDDGIPVLDVVAPVSGAKTMSPVRPGTLGGGLERELAAVGSIRFGLDLRPSERRAEQMRTQAVVSTLIVITLGILGTLFLVGTIVGPIQELARAAHRISCGDLDVHLEPGPSDEVGVLIRSFNRMADRLRTALRRQSLWGRDLERRVREKTREIEETRKHLADIVENIGASVLVADLDGTITSANSPSEEIFGEKPQWIVGKKIDPYTCDPSRRLDSILPAVRSTGRPLVYEGERPTWAPSEGPSTRKLLVTHSLLRDAEGSPTGVLQITKDVTALKQMEERLVTSERLSAMGEMAGEIGHELNNYLMAIGGRAELIPLTLARGSNSRNLEKVKISAQLISDQVAEMRKLTDGLLQSARKESSPEDIDLNALVQSTVDLIRPQNKYDRITFRVELAKEPLPLFADPQQLRQVLLNLIGNGAEATREVRPDGGTLTIETFREGPRAGFRVTDDGPGVSGALRDRIFEPHFTTKPSGHGFGLAVCHRVVTNHGGRIAVDTAPGRGACFTVQLGIREAAPAAASPPSSRETAPALSSPLPSPGTGSPSSRCGHP